MSWFRSPKFCAALVLIAWLASLIAVWGMAAAGHGAVAGDKACLPGDLKGLALQLELVSSPDEALQVLTGKALAGSCNPCQKVPWLCGAQQARAAAEEKPGRAACIRKGLAAQTTADFLFIPAYSALSLALFLFIATFWDAASPRQHRPLLSWTILALGLLLALVMAVADVRENFQLQAILHIAQTTSPAAESAIGERLPALKAATTLKWGALALSAALLAVFWRSHASSRLVWLPRFFGVATAAAFAAGLTVCGWRLVGIGMAGLFLLWLLGLVHALAVIVAPEPAPHFKLSRKGPKQP